MFGSSWIRQDRTAHQTLVADSGREAVLEQRYWLRRKRDELAMAWRSTSTRARLIHFDLAGRYSVKAANTEEPLTPLAPQ